MNYQNIIIDLYTYYIYIIIKTRCLNDKDDLKLLLTIVFNSRVKHDDPSNAALNLYCLDLGHFLVKILRNKMDSQDFNILCYAFIA